MHDHQQDRDGHDRHAGHSVAMFRDKFWLSLALTIPTLIWGHMLPRAARLYTAPASGRAPDPAGLRHGRLPLRRPAVPPGRRRELRARLPGMMTLIALAITVAFVFSVAVTLGYPGMPLWEELATLVTIMLLGHWIEMRSIAQAQGALAELAKLLPDTAVRIVPRGRRESGRRMCRSPRCKPATWCWSAPARAFRRTAKWSRATAASTSR